MSEERIRPISRYSPFFDYQTPNSLYRDYIESHLLDLQLQAPNQQGNSFEYYVADRFGVSPALRQAEDDLSPHSDEDLIRKVTEALASNIMGDSGRFSVADSPEYKLTNHLQHSEGGRVVVLHGDVGAGKSTLIRFVMNRVLQQVMPGEFQAIIIDALTVPRFSDTDKLSASDFRRAVIQETDRLLLEPFILVERQFHEQLAQIGSPAARKMAEFGFAPELSYFNQLFRRGSMDALTTAIIEFNRELLDQPGRFYYNLVRLAFMRDLARQDGQVDASIRRFNRIFVAFDNLDRTPRGTKELAIDLANHIVKLLGMPVVLTFRSREYYRIEQAFREALSEHGPPAPVRLPPPDLGYILAKKFKSSLTKVKKAKLKYRGKTYSANKALDEVLTKLVNLLLLDKSKQLLLAIHNGNIRDTANTFFDLLASSSRVLPVDRLIGELFDKKSPWPFIRHRLPFDQLLEMVALNLRVLYRAKHSLLANLYCCGLRAEPSNNILKVRILNFVAILDADEVSEIQLDDICGHFMRVFEYDTAVVMKALTALHDAEILWSPQGRDIETEGITAVQFRTPAIVCAP